MDILCHHDLFNLLQGKEEEWPCSSAHFIDILMEESENTGKSYPPLPYLVQVSMTL